MVGGRGLGRGRAGAAAPPQRLSSTSMSPVVARLPVSSVNVAVRVARTSARDSSALRILRLAEAFLGVTTSRRLTPGVDRRLLAPERDGPALVEADPPEAKARIGSAALHRDAEDDPAALQPLDGPGARVRAGDVAIDPKAYSAGVGSTPQDRRRRRRGRGTSYVALAQRGGRERTRAGREPPVAERALEGRPRDRARRRRTSGAPGGRRPEGPESIRVSGTGA